MTREEANEILSDWALCHYTPSKEAAEAVISALDPLDIITALRGPTLTPQNELLTCEGCAELGKWENEYEYGFPSPCTGCKRRAYDNYCLPPERQGGDADHA